MSPDKFRDTRHDAYGDRESQMTILVFLSDGYTGGRTVFIVPDAQAGDDGAQVPPNVVAGTCAFDDGVFN